VPPGGWIETPAPTPASESTGPASCPICDAPVGSLDEFERHLARRHGQLGMQRRTHPRSTRLDRASRWLVDAWYTTPVVFAAFPAILAYWLYLEVLGLPPLGARGAEGGYGLVAFLGITAFWALRATIPRRD
jgi:hypothetical protein